MSRGPHNFKQTDVAKAIKAAMKAGVRDWQVEIVDGKIVIRGGDERGDLVAEGGRSEWD
jgi:hypothetical protein